MPADFLDSNVLLCFASRDPAKGDRAEALMRGGATISVQVLNEIANVGRRKMRLGWDELEMALALIRRVVDVVPLTGRTHDEGLRIARRHNLAIYDSMILASALVSGCDTLWSEDMQNGLVVDQRLTIRNPFID
jgi:predicted nucleic acid-binding protein